MFSRDQFHQVSFDFSRLLLSRQAEALRKPRDVGIDDNPLVFLEGVSEHYVGGLTADPRERRQFGHRRRHFAVMIFFDRRGRGANAPGFVAKKPRRLDRLLQVSRPRPGKNRRRNDTDRTAPASPD